MLIFFHPDFVTDPVTTLSVSESHRFSAKALADCTAGRESHPALKICIRFGNTIAQMMGVVKRDFLW